MKAYYLHENSGCIFVDHYHRDWGPVESDFVHKIGLCFHGNTKELKKRFKRMKAKRTDNLKLSSFTIDLSFPVLPF